MARRRQFTVAVLAGFLLVYVGMYAHLSSAGQFVPGSWGLGWVKHYVWAPRGFVAGPAGTEQRRLLQAVFLPLWWVDMRFIHPSEKAYGEDYPINTVLDDELSKQLEEWKQNQAVEATADPPRSSP